jgi:hypothetical protein
MRLRALLLFLFFVAAALSAAQQRVGEITDSHPRTEGLPPLKLKNDVVFLNQLIRTNRKAWAQISIDSIEPNKEGMVRLGPDTEVMFTDFVVATAHGETPRMGLRLALGMLRLAFRPEGAEPGVGEYWITTSTPHAPPIRLLGTDIYVKVDPRDHSTTVVVVEGEAEITPVAGEPVRLLAGQWTRIEAGRPPTPPATAPAPDDGGDPGLPPFADGLLPPDPFNLRLRLDLPN